METKNKPCLGLKKGIIEVPEILTDCLQLLLDVKDKLKQYEQQTHLDDLVERNIATASDRCDSVAWELGEMINKESISRLYFKEE